MNSFLSDHWPISTLTESATAISNLRTCSSTQTAGFSSSVTLAAPNILCAGSPMSRTSAPDITGNIRLIVRQHLLILTSCRAPELIFGATDYTTNIDVWSAGCVFAGEWRFCISSQEFSLMCFLYRIDVGPANFPWRQWSGPACRDHQGSWHTDPGTDQGNESELHRVQVPPDQGASLAQSVPRENQSRGH